MMLGDNRFKRTMHRDSRRRINSDNTLRMSRNNALRMRKRRRRRRIYTVMKLTLRHFIF